MTAPVDEPTGARAGAEGASTLRDLPRELWHDLARAFRRAVEPLEDGDLPRAVRPFRGWKPDRLLNGHPRRAVADALADDARLRERVGAALGGEDTRARLDSIALSRLVAEEGEPRAAALLVSAGRWQDLATLAATVSARKAARERAAAERPGRPQPGEAGLARRDLEQALADARRECAEAHSAREHAESRARTLATERDELAARVRALQQEVAALEARLRDDRAKHRDRLERARRRAVEAESRTTLEEGRVRKAAEELERAAGVLRETLGDHTRPTPLRPASPPPGRGRDATRGAVTGAGSAPTHAVPRAVPPAAPGRPCRLPPGLTSASPAGVDSLLSAPGVLVIVDGYNVSKHPRGVGAASLSDQRHWLVRLLAGLAARYRVRVVVVFDSAEDLGTPLPGARGVVVDFATGAETADDRIVGMVEDLDSGQPVVVVTSDRELAARCAALDADIVSADAFLAVTA